MAIIRDYLDLVPVPLGVFITSVNYWRNPTLSWRRNVDIGVVFLSLVYQCIRAIWAEYGVHYYFITGIAVGCYVASQYTFSAHTGVSALFHVMVHVVGNVANIVLYLCHVEPIRRV